MFDYFLASKWFFQNVFIFTAAGVKYRVVALKVSSYFIVRMIF